MSTEVGRARTAKAVAASAAARRARLDARTEKTCPRCRRVLPVGKFSTAGKDKRGAAWCRDCMKASMADLYRRRAREAAEDWAAQQELPRHLRAPLCPGCRKHRPLSAYRAGASGQPRGRCEACR